MSASLAHRLESTSAPYPPGVAECRAPLMRPIPLPKVGGETYSHNTTTLRLHDRSLKKAKLCRAPLIPARELESHHDCAYIYCSGRIHSEGREQSRREWDDLNARYFVATSPCSDAPKSKRRLSEVSHFGNDVTNRVIPATGQQSNKERAYLDPQALPHGMFHVPLSRSPQYAARRP